MYPIILKEKMSMKLDPVTQKLLELKWHSQSDKEELEKKIADVGSKTLEKVKGGSIFDIAGKYRDTKDGLQQVHDLANQRLQMDKDNEESETVAKVVGVAAVLSAAVVLGNKIYKQYFSQAAQACKKFPDKEECMKRFKNKATEAEIAQLQKAKAYCKKSTNPKQCIDKLDQEIQKNKAKLSK
jgi:hypothetical protein